MIRTSAFCPANGEQEIALPVRLIANVPIMYVKSTTEAAEAAAAWNVAWVVGDAAPSAEGRTKQEQEGHAGRTSAKLTRQHEQEAGDMEIGSPCALFERDLS